MKLQYFHAMYTKGFPSQYTVAVEVPELNEFLVAAHAAIIAGNTALVINAGFSEVSEKDQYSKKIGRFESSKRLKEQEFYLKDISISGNGTTLYLVKNNEMFLMFQSKPEWKNVHLIDAGIYKGLKRFKQWEQL